MQGTRTTFLENVGFPKPENLLTVATRMGYVIASVTGHPGCGFRMVKLINRPDLPLLILFISNSVPPVR